MIDVADLGLRGDALSVAKEFHEEFPSAKLTSGRRSIVQQAHAMAVNVTEDPRWIDDTYVESPAKDALLDWLHENQSEKLEEIYVGFLKVLQRLSPDELAHLSMHLSGDAFDVEPDENEEIDRWLEQKAVDLGGKYLRKEGKLVRRHWQAGRKA